MALRRERDRETERDRERERERGGFKREYCLKNACLCVNAGNI